MAIGNEELMQECFSKHSCMGTARIKQDKEPNEKGKMRGVRVERSKVGMKKCRILKTRKKYYSFWSLTS